MHKIGAMHHTNHQITIHHDTIIISIIYIYVKSPLIITYYAKSVSYTAQAIKSLLFIIYTIGTMYLICHSSSHTIPNCYHALYSHVITTHHHIHHTKSVPCPTAIISPLTITHCIAILHYKTHPTIHHCWQ